MPVPGLLRAMTRQHWFRSNLHGTCICRTAPFSMAGGPAAGNDSVALNSVVSRPTMGNEAARSEPFCRLAGPDWPFHILHHQAADSILVADIIESADVGVTRFG